MVRRSESCSTGDRGFSSHLLGVASMSAEGADPLRRSRVGVRFELSRQHDNDPSRSKIKLTKYKLTDQRSAMVN